MSDTKRKHEERALYSRLIVYREDFSQAAFFADHLLKKGWHHEWGIRKIRWPTYMKQVAYTTALVNSYWRPFAGTRSTPQLALKPLNYDTKERELHSQIEELRNTLYAHSDIEIREIQPFYFDQKYATAIERLPAYRISKEQNLLLTAMIGKAAASIREQLQDLITRVLDQGE